MTLVLAVLENDGRRRLVKPVAEAIAGALSAEVRTMRISSEGARRVSELLAAVREPDVDLVVMSAQSNREPYWDVIQQSEKPVVVVPRRAVDVRTPISQVLLPLDGTRQTATAVSQMARRLTKPGTCVTPMHVFDQATTPPFWDQAAHAHLPWIEEFLLRNLPTCTSLKIRTGDVAAAVLGCAAELEADLILVGWSRRLSSGHAPTVRSALIDGTVPVMLIATGSGPTRDVEGRSPLAPGGPAA